MMKRTGVPRLGPDEPAPLPPQSPAQQIQQPGASNMHTLAQSAQPSIIGATAMLSVGGSVGGFARTAPRASGPPVMGYMKPAVQYAAPKQPPQVQPRLKQLFEQQANLPPAAAAGGRVSPGAAPPAAQFQRLKVEDALSYLDQVKFKFNTQPQVYNDFLDIMKEFKSQTKFSSGRYPSEFFVSSIDTPGVITRVSNLFKGHPELIVGFNTFLPPGYKIEVQSNGQVSVSMPSPTGMSTGGVLLGVHHPPPQPQLVHLLPVAQSVNSAIVHNLTVNAPPANTLHQISQAHQQIEAAAIHHPPGTVQPPAGSGPHQPAAPPGQPVEFNHAIEYVNKIKSRFSRQPDKYKRFLEILHAYQRGHRDVKEPQAKQQTEQEVYSQVAKLFENQDDLLAEFGQFLPDAKAVTKPHYPPHARTPPLLPPPPQRVESETERFVSAPPASPPPHAHLAQQIPKHTSSVSSNVVTPPSQHHHLKRSPSFTSSSQMPAGPPAKKSRISSGGVCGTGGSGGGGGSVGGGGGGGIRDVSLAEAAKVATLQDFNFFDRARKALRSQRVYDNFLRCLLLFTHEVISSSELLCVTSPFLRRHPELQKWLQDFVGLSSPPHTPTNTGIHVGYGSNSGLLSYGRSSLSGSAGAAPPDKLRLEPVGPLGAQLRHDRPQGDAAMDIDLSTCKRLGTSYCALPRDAAARRCSGRTQLCKEVLNDTWVSFPTWSEDSTFVTSRKTQYEEYIYRCEDERFELDVVIETNASTIRVLEGVQKKLSRMSPEDAAKYRLDDCLGGHSPTIHQRALRRIYGDKAVDIIAGLKKNPVVAVPVVLRRLKAKEEEWREAQKGFNKQWREQNEKYYLKSLDHQGINFKQNDLKAMRSKSLFNEVESAYAARRPGPHLIVDYNMQSRQEAIKIVRDAAELLIHHARRQTAIQKAEKRRIKQLLRRFLPDLFSHPRQPLSDDEKDEEEKDDPASPDSPSGDQTPQDDKATPNVKSEKQESSESDNASDKSGRNNKNDKENKPKNNNHTDSKDTNAANSVKRNSSNEDSVKMEIKMEQEEDDYRDYPPNEARFVCTAPWYLFLRLHGAVCQRLAGARRAAAALARQDALDGRARPPAVAHALRLKPNNLPADASSPSEYYNALLELVKGVLDGNIDSAAYEDAAREMLGIKAYPAYTLDKLVSIAVRQLQQCVSEPWSVRAAEMCARGGMRGGGASYLRRAASYLRGDHAAFLVRVYGGEECKVTFELLEGAGEGRSSPHNNDNSRLSPTNQLQCRAAVGAVGAVGAAAATNGAAAMCVSAVARLAAWSLYSERYARPDASDAAARPHKPVFLRRTARPRAARRGAAAERDLARNAAAPTASPAPPHDAARRRKPPRISDATECTITHTLRLLTSRPLQLYRAGALSAARTAARARSAAARRDRFHAWLAQRRPL
ncbi:paired amphipathic helix protein Sin3b isoform X2 [Galleria mellonella]|uniref:Paired amphipathic helix protein Sin3b isoform X2 n=1 Tax=Galleria mellonella TaxID=7137 RepID=A0ABM3MSW0_GALME|nr:paired amphipathic helix protein Sin3b isoform X2 [Galleria mellonella]